MKCSNISDFEALRRPKIEHATAAQADQQASNSKRYLVQRRRHEENQEE